MLHYLHLAAGTSCMSRLLLQSHGLSTESVGTKSEVSFSKLFETLSCISVSFSSKFKDVHPLHLIPKTFYVLKFTL